MSYKQIFSDIYDNFGFGSEESRSGPGSTLEETKFLREKLKELVKQKDIKSVVDIPCGDFNWMKEIVFSFESYTGGDVVEQCIKTNNEEYGNKRVKFINFDLINDNIPYADLLIVRDVIGHFPIEDGKKIVDNILKSNCKYLLSTTWAKKIENKWSKCNTNDVHRENEGVDYGRFYPVNLMAEPFNFPEADIFLEENVRVDNFDIGNRKALGLWDLQRVKEHLKTFEPKKNNIASAKSTKELTIVSGLWNINRHNRDFSHYIENFKKFLDIDANLFLYVPKELEDLVWSKRNKTNTYVKVYELDDVKRMYSPFWDKTQEIRNSPTWRNKTGENGWLKNSPQSTLEWYNPIVQSKMFWLNDVTIWNPFDSKYFMWLDAGITNTVNSQYVTDPIFLNNVTKYLDPFLFLSYPYQAVDEIHGFDYSSMNRYSEKKVEYVCRGGLFGGTKESINEANGMYYSLLNNTLSEGLMGTEESVFTIMSYLYPEKYRRYSLDGNGLIVKFVQSVISDSVKIEEIPQERKKYERLNKPTNSYKVSLYMLTFNFPHQVEHTIKKWLKHSKWITDTRNILIDNSTNEEARISNSEICKKYNFEHIITNDNTGINGGRFRAAQHFDQSDSGYYIFLEDDMGIHPPEDKEYCRNGFRKQVYGLYDKVLKIMSTSEVDFLKLSFTEVYMDNHIQVSWYNVPQNIRTQFWSDYDKLPVTGLDPNCPRTQFDKIDNIDGLSYATGDIYYCNWPTIMGKEGNRKVFLDTTWARPYEQTWMSYVFQETKKGNIKPAVLLASPIDHDRIAHYKPEERREN